MKIQVIGDLHGNPTWKELVDLNRFDKIVFIGDYFDSNRFSRADCYKNLKEVIEFKKANLDKVELLVGNHDNHYLFYNTAVFSLVKASGFSATFAWKLKRIFNANIKYFKAAVRYGNYLISHAGVTNFHFNSDLKSRMLKDESIDELLNRLWMERNPIIFKISKERGGSDNCSSIFWADKSELKKDPLSGYHQVVGHTASSDFEFIEIDSNTSINFIDLSLNDYLDAFVLNVQ